MGDYRNGLLGRQWSIDEIADTVLTVFPVDWGAITAVAIALAESGGYQHAVNVADGDPDSLAHHSMDLGIWQTNTYWHPELPIQGALDPAEQILYVYHLTKKEEVWGYDWTPWHTYTSGAYSDYMSMARKAINKSAGTSL